jgi:hypothetical protein
MVCLISSKLTPSRTIRVQLMGKFKADVLPKDNIRKKKPARGIELVY